MRKPSCLLFWLLLLAPVSSLDWSRIAKLHGEDAATKTTTDDTKSTTSTATTCPDLPQEEEASPLITTTTLSPLAQKVRVRNVYDGDTLTLTDGRRVRLLGIDTPELKPPQPFAQEAKQYTKTLCTSEIYILSEGEDHYGRLLATIWVRRDNDTFLNVNLGLVSAGLATAYTPDQHSKPPNWKTLLKLQAEALDRRKGLWRDFKDQTFFKTKNGSAYHRRDCPHLQHVRNLYQIRASDAVKRGLHPCRTCLG